MLNEAVKRVLKESMWDLATCAGNEPNVVPVAFKDVTEAGRLVVGDVFLETTLNNLKANGGRIAISVYDAKNLEGYQIKGTAEYVTEGEVVRTFKAMVEKMFNGAVDVTGNEDIDYWETICDEVCVCNTIKQMLEASVIQLAGAFFNIKFIFQSTL